ncbi:hypothetical protein MKW98_015164 [Papaver atlanticum]|uniref:Dirigent protein n=1 Tax=Papaver atlanticum TaxID=357466 RepID=A0AAD4T6I4_9MAGN|nr:hypothetical protein MKW98_015164 [Papaver atlanticum]
MGMADIHSKRSLSVAMFSIYGKLFPALGNPVQLGLRKEKFSHFRVYWHDNASSSNPTTIQVAGANSTQDSITGFGAILFQRLGRAQGTYTFAGIDEPVVLANANIVFTTGKYNGSTLGIMGRNILVPADPLNFTVSLKFPSRPSKRPCLFITMMLNTIISVSCSLCTCFQQFPHS